MGGRAWSTITIVQTFLLFPLQIELQALLGHLSRRFYPRAGEEKSEASTPLYRLHTAAYFLVLSRRAPLLP